MTHLRLIPGGPSPQEQERVLLDTISRAGSRARSELALLGAKRVAYTFATAEVDIEVSASEERVLWRILDGVTAPADITRLVDLWEEAA